MKTLIDRQGGCPSYVGTCWCKGPTDHSGGPFMSIAVYLNIIPYVDDKLSQMPPSQTLR